METKSSLCILRSSFLLLALVSGLLLSGCVSNRLGERRPTPLKEEAPTEESQTKIPESLRPTLPVIPEIQSPTSSVSSEGTREQSNLGAANVPKIGLILGPGAVRAYAHVGVVQELAKAKLPIVSVVGIETGALVASIFAAKGQAFDAEWQMFKLKDFRSMGNFLSSIFQNQKVEDFKVSFACPSFNLQKQQNFMMNKGQVSQMLPYCLSYPPLLRPYNKNVAGVTELKAAAEYLRSKGANYIIYVHVLNGTAGLLTKGVDEDLNVSWNTVAQALSRQWPSVDYVISVSVQDIDLINFDQRRVLLQRGLDAGQNAAAQIARRLGL